MDYRLLVEIDNQWRELDLGDEKPSMNYVQNDIGEIKDRRSNYSHKLQLPLTDGNVIALGMIDRIESAANVADRLLPCRLYCDEYEIVGTDGLMQIISVSNDCITVQVISGIADLFEKLKNSKMSDIDLGIFKSEDSYFLPQNFTDFCMVGLACFQHQYPYYSQAKMGNTLPFARFIKVVDKVLASHGYTLDTNIRNEVKDIVLPVVVPPQQPENYADYFILKAENQTSDHSTGLAEYWKITGNLTEELIVYSGAERDLFWRVARTGKANIYINVKQIAAIIVTSLRLTITKNGNTIFKDSLGLGVAFNQELSVTKGDIYMFRIETDNIYTPGSLAYEILINTKRNPYTDHFYYLPISISSSLGFDTQLSILKAFVNTFGLYVDIDNKKKVVKAHTFQKVLDYKARQIDWTNKVDMREFECEFHSQDFAQHNYIRFEDNTKEEVNDMCKMDINDSVLQYEKTLIKLPFEAGKDGARTFGGAFIPLIKNLIENNKEDDNDNEYKKVDINATKPHLCKLGSVFPFNFGAGQHNYSLINHFKASDIKRYYESLFDVLNKYRNVTVKMLLEPQDLEVMQERIPVYLQQFGHYFYINSVRNYVCGQLAEVEMIRV